MINSRDIDELTPRVAAKCREFVAHCAADGTPVLITSTYRDNESQNELYAKGRTTPGPKITNVQGGHSFHQYRVAFDFVPLNEFAIPQWSTKELWDKCGLIGEACGLEWGGNWKTFVDRPHMQYTGGRPLADYLAGLVEP